MSKLKRIGILTGGGDCPGLNAVIRAVAKSALLGGLEVVGIEDGFLGLIENRTRPLSFEDVSGILTRGGTILGSCNKADPSSHLVLDDGKWVKKDVRDRAMETFIRHELDAVVVIGGDGTMSGAAELIHKGMTIVGVPKTIDNDLYATEVTFGHDTAVNTAAEALDKVHTTASSHHRAMVVELMGRYAGWLALHAGLAAGADVILIPEIPFDIDKVCAAIQAREADGKHYSIVVVAEGARPVGGEVSFLERRGTGTVDRIGGIGSRVAGMITERMPKEVRSIVLGHLQRGGSPTTFDRLLGLRFGGAAVRAVADGAFGTMLGLAGTSIVRVPLADAVGRQKLVPLDSDILVTAREQGISLGD